MKTYQNALLAGVAALALVAGTGLASAQQQPNDQSTAPKARQSAGQMHAAHPTQHSGMQAQGPGKTGMTAQNAQQGAQPNAKGAARGMQQNANMAKKGPQQHADNGKQGTQQTANGKQGQQPSVAQKAGPESGKQNQASNTAERRNRHMTRSERMSHGRQTAAQREREMHERRMTAQRENQKHGRQATAQRQRGLHGLQANASGQMQHVQTSSGTNVRLSEQQRTRIHETIINGHNAPRVGHVNFSVNVGTVIPRDEFTTIHVVPVPEYLVRIDPRWRGLEYFIFSDEVVIVNPHDLRIIAIVPV